MRTENLAPASTGDPLRNVLAHVKTAAVHWPAGVADAERQQVEAALAAHEECRPVPASRDARAVITGVADAQVAALLAGDDGFDIVADAAERVAAFDAQAVALVAWMQAGDALRRHYAGVLMSHAEEACEAWTQRLRAILAEHREALGGKPLPSELEALRAGGAAAKRWSRAVALREEWGAILVSHRALRMLEGAGTDGLFDTSVFLGRYPPGGLDRFDRDAMRAIEDGQHVMSVIDAYGLADAVRVCMRAQQDADIRAWRAERDAVRAGTYIPGTTDVVTHDIHSTVSDGPAWPAWSPW